MFKKMKEPRFMIATTAKHGLGDISRDDGDYCWVSEETKGWYQGAWRTGYGFVNVKFPKDSTRELRPDETEHIKNTRVVIE